MKGIYVIAIAFLASGAVSAANLHVQSVSSKQDIYVNAPVTVCPYPSEEFPENTTTNLPHETDCTKFYKCFIGANIEQLCPKMIPGDDHTRLHYNRLLQVCDWPWQAGCTHCPEKDRNGIFPPPVLIPDIDDNGQTSCTKYYRCDNGVKQEYHCTEPGTCFSRTCQACVRNRVGGYCDDSIPTPTPTPPCIPGSRKPHDCNCLQYHECENINGIPEWLTRDCQGGLHFSPTRLICMEPNIAGCRWNNP